METRNKKIVIVGAGMAGLTAAAYLCRKKYNVLLLDKNDRTGGLVNTFESGGFYFDSGPRAFINSGIVKPILKDLGIRWDLFENKISIGIEDQLFGVNSMDDLQKYQQVLIHLYPESKDDINRIIAIMHQLSAYNKVLYEFDNPNFGDVLSDKKFVFKKLIPWTFKFLYALSKLNQYNLPMEEYLRGLTKNQSLADILIQHFFRKTPAYFALGYFYGYLDYFYPKGGTGALNRLLKEKVLSWGGDIRLDKNIVEVIPSESVIVDAEGRRYPYDHLIWAADLKTLYRCLNPVGLEAKAAHKIQTEAQRILSSKGAESVFMLFVAVNRPISYFQQNGGAHMFYTPSRQGLGETNKQERRHLIENFEKTPKAEVISWLEKYLQLNTYEISIPALRDGSMAPDGQTGLMISCLFDYDVMEKVEKAGWYDEFKSLTENRMIDIFSKTIYKNLKEDVLFKFSSTPLTIHQIAGSSEGAITGWSFETEPPVIHKLKDIPKSVLTPVSNIYQAGQWAYSPAGVPIAMLTGWYATQKILKRSKKQ
ncbi:MAG: NAD(P)/FAD-dependent oxidoreductase [Anaerolineae bacterium]|nr:NAD(P)/FAD-dependent oxidoreductase [Anaerolineae bacterium]